MKRAGILVAVATFALALCPAARASAQGNPYGPWPVAGFSNPNGTGYWLAYRNGSVGSEGNAHHFGDAAYLPLNRPIVGGAAHGYAGYWLVGDDGGVFSFGSARFHGSMSRAHLNSPIVSMA